MNAKNRKELLYEILFLLFNIGLFCVGIVLDNKIIKWILFVLSSILILLACGFIYSTIDEQRKENRKECIIKKSLHPNFTKNIQNCEYRKKIIDMINRKLDKKETFRLSIQTVNLIFVDLDKAKHELSKENFAKIQQIYFWSALSTKNIQLTENERKDFISHVTYEMYISDYEDYFNELTEAFVPYLSVAPLSSFTVLSNDDCIKIENNSKSYSPRDMYFNKVKFIDKVYDAIHESYSISINELKVKIDLLNSGERDCIETKACNVLMYQNNCNIMSKKLLESPLDMFLNEAKHGIITIQSFKKELHNYFAYERKYECYKKELKKQIDSIVYYLNLENRKRGIRDWICGTYLNSSEDINYNKMWYQFVDNIIPFLLQSEIALSHKINILKNLIDESDDRAIQDLNPKIEANIHNKLKKTEVTIYEQTYAKISAERIIDFSNDSDFGLIPEKPIFVKSADGANEYIKKLQTLLGESITWKQKENITVDGIQGEITVTDAFLPSGKKYKTLYISLYGYENPTKAPHGFKFI